MIALPGNVRPEATLANDRGLVSGSLPLEHMLLQLKRPADREAALVALSEEQHRQSSPSFHHWLTADEIGEKYGPNQADVTSITDWLKTHGFTVNSVSKTGTLIDFSGNAAQVSDAFRTEIHQLSVKGESHIANMQDPQVPAALSDVIEGVVSLNDFRPHAANKGIAAMHIDPVSKTVVPATAAKAAHPNLTASTAYQLVVPDDLHTIYNFNPVYARNITGKGQKVVVIEDTNVYSTNDWNVFRSTFGLSKYKDATFTQVHPGGCTNPGVVVGDDGEAILDAEYASAAAPDAAIVLASCANTQTTFGGLLALKNLIDEPAPPAIVSISYGECEAGLGAAGNAVFNHTYLQAAIEGVSVFVASGDEGAASCDAGQFAAEYGIAVSGFASTPYNVAVGGTDFADSYEGTNGKYWNATNNATYGSAKSYIPEIPWNDSCASNLISTVEGYSTTYGANGFCNSPVGEAYFLTTGSGSGGPSGCAYGNTSPLDGTAAVSGTCKGYAKPLYQIGMPGNPNDHVRDIPDVSLFAANGVWGHYYAFCYTDPAPNAGGAPCTGNPENWSGAGGTSFASPIVAGIQALINQQVGFPQGNPNYVYYGLARLQDILGGSKICNATLGNELNPGCIFHDVTLGDMDVDCLGPFNCYTPSGQVGVLSTTSTAYKPAYGTNGGWDFATGNGSMNVANLIKYWADLI